MTEAVLVLEDGRVFPGTLFGAGLGADCLAPLAGGEVVFNTAMLGYQEVLSDPSYARQLVVMTYPLQGNYGLAPEDFESRGLFLGGFIVKEVSRLASNWRHRQTLDECLRAHGVVGLCGVDTRALVRHLRTHGALRGVISVAPGMNLQQHAQHVPAMTGCDLAATVTTPAVYTWSTGSPRFGHGDAPAQAEARLGRVVVVDFGVKYNILRQLVDLGCAVTVVPAHTDAETILSYNPRGVVLSNGPGDPEPLAYAVQTIQKLLGRVPLLGICLGHQLLALALGGKSFKLKFGHHGANHPVLNLETGNVEITSQNHGFAIDAESLPASRVAVTHINLNDQTLEGLRAKNVPALSVQYHPEAAPGPHDSAYLFERFVAMF